MGKLEIRNLESSKSHLIEDVGAVLGREGGDAEITLGDQGVSKKHARIYFKRGTWYLEDLDSANGTYLEDERIAAPAPLVLGAVFTMSRQQFEVTQILADHEEPVPAEDEGDRAETNALEAGDLPDRLRSAAKGRRVNSGAELRSAKAAVENEEPQEEIAASRTRTSRPGGAVKSAARPRTDDADPPAPTFAAFGAALPRAIAHYGKAVPLMAVNPLGSIRKGIAEQPLPALSSAELIAFALPPLLFSALVGAICSAIAAAASGAFSARMLFPVIPLLSAVIGAVVAGLVCHPALGWLIERVDGQSDARSRTNLFAMCMSASAVLALPGALAALLSLIPVSAFALLAPLLMLAATGVMLFLWFSWFRYFGVAQWSEYVVLGLGALGVIGAVYALVMTSVHTFSHPSEAVAVAAAEQPSEPEHASPPPPPPPPPPAASATTAAVAQTPTPKPEAAAATVATPPADPKPVPRGTQPPYAEYREMRTRIEKALEDDPALLRDKPGIVRLYRDLLVNTKVAEGKFWPPEKNPAAEQINRHLRNLDVYNATWKNVVDLNNALSK